MTGLAVAAIAVGAVGVALQVARRAAARWWARVAAVANQRPANPNPPVAADGYPQIFPADEVGRHGRSGCSCGPLLSVHVTAAGDPVPVLLHQPLAPGPSAAR